MPQDTGRGPDLLTSGYEPVLAAAAHPMPQTLTAMECYRLLESETVGRVSYASGALPAMAPVVYELRGLDILLRTERDQNLAQDFHESVITLQVDHIVRDTLSGWQVTVTGVATPYPGAEENAGAMLLSAASRIVCGRAVRLT